jgi:hypothetical protein
MAWSGSLEKYRFSLLPIFVGLTICFAPKISKKNLNHEAEPEIIVPLIAPWRVRSADPIVRHAKRLSVSKFSHRLRHLLEDKKLIRQSADCDGKD